ncbi:penicillin-binding protein 1C [Aeromonas enteropelogenes]|uniref:penicillin-binding protein 1C n=1 Tax=Aeromonas enteropelogenes TaxID=29489 RepID=UPI0005A84A02|nr:penicillin-binding protein 1C [Aeromonas enteropelogenes]UBH57500.1 penicillin-binding protein 1C [Aeromonas enteropelogenes]
MGRRRSLGNDPSLERVRPLTFWQRGWLKLGRSGRACRRWLGCLPRWLRYSGLGAIVLLLSLLALDRIFPPPPLDPAYARVVLDMKGRPLRAFADTSGVWRYPVTLDQVSPRYIEALLGYEDRYFWRHPGVNPVAMVRGVWLWLRHGRAVSGGSTLTMQVARLLEPYHRSVPGKLRQMARALQLEWHYDKRTLLTVYLNRAPFGGNLEGVQAASFAYLGKSAAKLTHAEAALLAVLPQAPSRYRPDRHPERARAARDKVMLRLVRQGAWPEAVWREGRIEPVLARARFTPMEAPLFARLAAASQPGALVHTTIDGDLQRWLEGRVESYIRRFPEQTSAALLLVDNRTMAVRAYVGSAEYGNLRRHGYLDMVQAIRSPGSTLKPFIYGLALDEGLVHSASLLSDAPRLGADYRPANFTGAFQGPVTLTRALQQSLNVPAVQVLEALGADKLVSRLDNAGVRLALSDKPNPAIALGAAGIRLEQLVALYSALTRQGQVAMPVWLADQQAVSRPLLSPGAAWIIWQILSAQGRADQPFASEATGRVNRLAWKTGTSYGYRDSWALGVSGRWTLGVWLGRPDGTPMPGFYGQSAAVPLLLSVYSRLGDDSPLPVQPNTVSEAEICWPLGRRASTTLPETCLQRQSAWLLEERDPPTLPDPLDWPSPLRQVALTDQGKPTMPRCREAAGSGWRALWPLSLEPWRAFGERRQAVLAGGCAGEAARTELQAPIRILALGEGNLIRSERYRLQPRVLGGVGKPFWFLNGQRLRWDGDQVLSKAGRYQLVVVDEAGNSDRIEFRLENPS